jgi:hypothetical protein
LCAARLSAKLTRVQRRPVQSRALRTVGYDAEAEELEIEFHSGQVYVYERVPRSVYEWLLRTPNKGIFVTRQIVGRYVERSVPQGEATPPDALEQVLRASLERLDPRAPG